MLDEFSEACFGSELALAGDHGAGGVSGGLSVLWGLLGGASGRAERRATSRPPTGCATTSTTIPRGGWCCSASISPPSPVRGRWSGRCWRRNGATFPASPGSSSGPAWPAASTTSWSCWPRCGKTACRCPRSPATCSGPISGSHHHAGHAVHHHRHAGRRRQGRGQCPERKRLGHVYDRRHHPRRAGHRACG